MHVHPGAHQANGGRSANRLRAQLFPSILSSHKLRAEVVDA